jgi:hypothetical protein
MGKHHYHDKKKRLTKSGAVDAGKGKVRPHHRKAARNMDKRGLKKGHDADTWKHRRKQAEISRVHQTPNKYQTEAKKVAETGNSETYEWFEDNGHSDHIQLRRTSVTKQEERLPATFGATSSKKYQENYDDIFGKKDRGVNVEGGIKKFKKTYK